jgi:O-antigen/teichoic acid export membrane protein
VTAAVAASFVLRQVVQQIVLTGVGIGAFATIQIAPSAFTLAAVLVLAVTGALDVTTTIAVPAVSAVLGICIGVGTLRRRGALGRNVSGSGVAGAAEILRPYLRYAAVLFLVLSLGQIVQRVDILLIEGIVGARDAGLYAVAAQIGDLAMILPAAVGAIVFRRGSLSSEGHWHDAVRALVLTAVAGIAIAIAIAAAAPEVIRHLVGAEYLDSVGPLRLLLPGIVLLGVQTVMSNYVVSRGHEMAVLWAWVTSAVVGVGLDLVVIPAAGITGAAIVSSISYALVMVMHIRAVLHVRASVRAPGNDRSDRPESRA